MGGWKGGEGGESFIRFYENCGSGRLTPRCTKTPKTMPTKGSTISHYRGDLGIVNDHCLVSVSALTTPVFPSETLPSKPWKQPIDRLPAPPPIFWHGRTLRRR